MAKPTIPPRVAITIRIGVGIWLIVLTIILCAGVSWWGLLLLAPAALHFHLAYRLHRRVRG